MITNRAKAPGFNAYALDEVSLEPETVSNPAASGAVSQPAHCLCGDAIHS